MLLVAWPMMTMTSKAMGFYAVTPLTRHLQPFFYIHFICKIHNTISVKNIIFDQDVACIISRECELDGLSGSLEEQVS